MEGSGRVRVFLATLSVLLAGAAGATLPNIQTLQPKPLAEVVKTQLKPVQAGGRLPIYLITWGGDVATLVADSEGYFKDEGVDVTLATENDLAKQVQNVLDGKTPYLRGTMGMINAAAEAFKAAGTDLVVVYQMTWSAGGDTMTVRDRIKKANDLCSAVVGLQLYGPHMDYAARILSDAGCRLSGLKFRWFKDLQLPSTTADSGITDPVSAFQADPSMDAVMAISPDAAMLTSGGAGKVGTGAEGSVKGAYEWVTSRSANRIIADVYAVRADYFTAHKDEVQHFVHALMRGQEALQDLMANKQAQQVKYRQVLSRAADVLLGAPQATADVEGLLSDCEFVGYDGNVGFFTGKFPNGETDLRTVDILTHEIQGFFREIGLMTRDVPIQIANWDYGALARGLRYVKQVAKPKFDAARAAREVEKEIAAEPTTWETQGTLFVKEINFDPNQSEFPGDRYKDDFEEALKKASTYGGALFVIEGHSDPLGILQAKQRGEQAAVVGQMEQAAKNLSLARANSVRRSFLAYCQAHKFKVDDSQFVAVGLGIGSPKYNPPRTKEEWAANRRVVFRIKQVEAEPTEFQPVQ
jgi:ABC-type nitrate/sulfonate/bicarbonate transport system substrate-binding protein/outer membrane protein OmpA-like peptidoglycan-associated protein